MKFGLGWKLPMIAFVLLIALIFVLPSFLDSERSALGRVLGDQKINLGLDLRGGIHLTLDVDVEKAVANTLSQIGQDLRADALDEKLALLRPRVRANNTLEAHLLKADQEGQLKALLGQRYPNLRILSEGREESRTVYILGLDPEYRENLASLTLDQAVQTIRNRIDQFGVAEPDIRRQQGGRIQVQLPGLSDTERALAIIGRTAHLEFKIVDEEADIEKALKGVVPPGSELSFIQRRDFDGSTAKGEPIVLNREAVMTGQHITDARTSFDEYGQPYVSLSFNPRGARIFERVTGENVNRRLAIVLDGVVHSAPVIQERISGGKASISGRFTAEETHDLAIVLRAGALPAPVNILEERTVGPSLGQESIEKGINAALIGGALTLIFMAVYYGFAGIVANLMLIFNILLIMAGLAAFGATLTLPGIAGIILTIGMSVDANVLIFERIREELRKGAPTREAIVEGFDRATLTILDANVTTIIAALILYQFGTGPIRGFAVTLSLGILASMFTAIVVSRVFFDLWTSRMGKTAKLSI
jgi:preprotein translocase subunit SecD